MKVQYFKENEFIIKEGEIGDTFYIMLSGHVLITKTKTQEFAAGESTQIVLGNLHSGDSFGELALINDKPRAASVKTI
jgi:cAMP-dependent protein kinase regulator